MNTQRTVGLEEDNTEIFPVLQSPAITSVMHSELSMMASMVMVLCTNHHHLASFLYIKKKNPNKGMKKDLLLRKISNFQLIMINRFSQK